MGQVPPRAPHQRHRRRYRYRGRCREDQRYVDREVLMRKRAFTGFVLGTVLGAFGLCLGIIAHDTLTPTVLADVVCAQTQGSSILNPIFTGTAAMASGTFSGLLTANGGLTIASNTFNFRRGVVTGGSAPTCTFTSGGGTSPLCHGSRQHRLSRSGRPH